MDEILSILGSFPPPLDATASNKHYDHAIKGYLKLLNKLSENARSVIIANAGELFDILDPAVNSIGFLAVLNILLSATEISFADREDVLDQVLRFLLSFDPYQVRYVGTVLHGLIEQVGTGNLFSPIVSVELMASALLRLDPSGTMFTSSHLTLVKLAYTTNSIDPVLNLINHDITLYSGMVGQKDSKILCDKKLSPTAYISPSLGSTDVIKSAMVLEYNVLCGLIHMSQRDWAKAQMALERVITHPSKDRGVSKFMSESYKKWLLVGLLNEGTTPSLPPYTSAAAKNTYFTIGSAYFSIAENFSTANVEQMQAELEANREQFADDANMALINEVVASFQEWQIIKLRNIYQQIPISRVREMTLSAETGRPLDNDQEVLALLRSMISSGKVKAELQVGGDDEESYLTFQDDTSILSEKDFAKAIARSHLSIEFLGKQYQRTNERLSSSKEYVRHMVREQKRLDKDGGDAGIGFDTQIEDEDLMTGIMAHS